LRADLGRFGRQRFFKCSDDGLDQASRDPVPLPQCGHLYGRRLPIRQDGNECAGCHGILDQKLGQIGDAKAGAGSVDKNGLAVCRKADPGAHDCACAVSIFQIPFDEIAADREGWQHFQVLWRAQIGMVSEEGGARDQRARQIGDPQEHEFGVRNRSHTNDEIVSLFDQ
jgi:hypothetical protein